MLLALKKLWQLQYATESNYAGISGLVVEYVVAIDVTRVRFPADAHLSFQRGEFPRIEKTPLAGLEPAIFGLEVQRVIHYATRALSHVGK